MKMWDIDGNGTVGALSDGLMILKYVIGLRGDELTSSGALIGMGALRETNAAIEGYLEQIEPYLDINGDGLLDYTDGWLIFLALLGFTDASLTDNNIRPGGTRVTSDAMLAYVAKMVDEFP